MKRGTIDVLNADEFRTLVNARGNATERGLLGTDNTIWQEEIYRAAFSTDNNLSLSGGIKGLPYRFNLGYLNQDGILQRSNLQRSSVALNLSPRFLDNHLLVNANGRYARSQNFFANEGAIGAAFSFDPTKPIYSGKSAYGGYYEWMNNNALKAVAVLVFIQSFDGLVIFVVHLLVQEEGVGTVSNGMLLHSTIDADTPHIRTQISRV